MSLVRLLGYTTLACGCVVGRYREVASNREVDVCRGKGADLRKPRASPQSHGCDRAAGDGLPHLSGRQSVIARARSALSGGSGRSTCSRPATPPRLPFALFAPHSPNAHCLVEPKIRPTMSVLLKPYESVGTGKSACRFYLADCLDVFRATARPERRCHRHVAAV